MKSQRFLQELGRTVRPEDWKMLLSSLEDAGRGHEPEHAGKALDSPPESPERTQPANALILAL